MFEVSWYVSLKKFSEPSICCVLIDNCRLLLRHVHLTLSFFAHDRVGRIHASFRTKSKPKHFSCYPRQPSRIHQWTWWTRGRRWQAFHDWVDWECSICGWMVDACLFQLVDNSSPGIFLFIFACQIWNQNYLLGVGETLIATVWSTTSFTACFV